MSTHALETLSNQAVAFAGVVYFLALIAYSLSWTRGPRAAFHTRLAFILSIGALVLHLVAVLARAFAAERVPWGNMYEFTLSGTLLLGLVFLALYRKLRLDWAAPFVTGVIFVLLMLAVVVLYTPVEPLTESLHSYWLVIHVCAAIIATGGFTLGGLVAVAYLLRARSEAHGGRGFGSRLPELPRLERTAYVVHAFAFPIWTFAVLIAGPIWAHQAWGSAWNWDPKEVWAFITWVVYAAYLHARTTAGWRGKRAAWIAIIGVLTLWFNFVGINYFSSTSMHSYAEGVSIERVLDLQRS